MLQIRPNCEHCNCDLPADSTKAHICSYECTFCKECVENVLHNVCPNCGGGFERRPVRPAKEHRRGVSRSHQKPATDRIIKPVDLNAFQAFRENLEGVPPNKR